MVSFRYALQRISLTPTLIWKAGSTSSATLPTVRPSPANHLVCCGPKQVDHAVLEKDLSDILFVTDRRLTKAILEDMGVESGMEHTSDTQDVREWSGRHRSAPLRLNSSVSKGGQNADPGDLPPAGTKTKTFVANVLPELTRLSSVIGR